MKIRTGKRTQGEEIACQATGLWQACAWPLTGTNLQEELRERARIAVGIDKTKFNAAHYCIDLSFRPAPKWAFEVSIRRWDWKEVTE